MNHTDLTFQVFAKEDCPICQKAQSILTRLGVRADVRYVDGPKATAENVAAFAWHDWVDKMPLVVVTEDEEELQRWDGNTIAGRWMPVVQEWIATNSPAPAGEQPA